MSDLLKINDLRLEFRSMRGVVKALDGVNLTVGEREILGLVGESGCGKSVTGFSVLGLLPRPIAQFTGGEILLRGENLLDKSEHEMQAVRGKVISMVFQDPLASLNPVFTVGEQITRVVKLQKGVSGRQAQATTREALAATGLPATDEHPQELPASAERWHAPARLHGDGDLVRLGAAHRR